MTKRIPLVGVLLLVLFALPTRAQEPGALTEKDLAGLEVRFRKVAAQVKPACVAVLGLIGMGSGVVIDRSGLVLTNAHVALAAPHCAVVFPDGRRVLARRLGIYFPRDLALIQLPEGDYAAVEPAPLAPIGKGTWVVAFGHPGGLKPDQQPSFCAGQVTGTVQGVAVNGILNYSGGIESDLAIYSGNSGGPMFDLEGRLLGIDGAVNPESGASFTLGLDIIHDVLPKIAETRIYLSDQVVLDPAEPTLKPFFDLYEPLSLQTARNWIANGWPGEKMTAEAPARPSGTDSLVRRILDRLDPMPKDAGLPSLVEGRQGEARQKRVAAALAAVCAANRARTVRLVGEDGRAVCLGTVIAPGFVVTKASLLGDRSRVSIPLAARESVDAVRVSVDAADDLALLRAEGLAAPGTDAPGAAESVGRWVVAPDAEGRPIAVGVQSAEVRSVPAAAESLLPEAMSRGIQWAMIRILRAAPAGSQLRRLADQLEAADRGRRIFELGNAPHRYPTVVQHDAPLDPERMGGPILDRAGRLLGVNVGRAHHGTTYAVPIDAVRAAFRKELAGK